VGKTIGTLAALVAAGAVGGIAFVYSGFYDVGADKPHWPITHRILETVRHRSIKAHAAGITAPANLGDQDRITAGAVHFATHCAICHSAPGVKAGDLAQGMYPKPPELTHVSRKWAPGELFWILKHGIKMSAMPSWADHADDQLWNSVAFLEKLPDMTPDDYKKLLETAKAKGGTR
jgi:mono/diheme cytochrome c family protein